MAEDEEAETAGSKFKTVEMWAGVIGAVKWGPKIPVMMFIAGKCEIPNDFSLINVCSRLSFCALCLPSFLPLFA